MPVVFQQMIYRADLRRNPTHLYLFGDNEERRGMGGQAAEMRGEPNAHGIRVKKAPTRDRWALWFDEDFDRACLLIKEDFEKPYKWISNGKTVVIPSAGIGTDRAELQHIAPRIYEFILHKINILQKIGEDQTTDHWSI